MNDHQQDEHFAQIKVGVMCYLHLWASLRKHVKVSIDDITQGIGLWDDKQGGYFAAFTDGNARTMRAGETYVCALSDEGPMVGQLDKIPPCTPVILDRQVLFLLEGLAQIGAGQPAEKSVEQVDMIAALIHAAQRARGAIH
jgi:hypothetical protein